MASDFELQQLRAELAAARLQAKAATQREKAAAQRETEATQQAAAADQRALRAEQKARPTTLEELLWACHIGLFQKFAVQTIKPFTTRGSVTSPVGKSCPKFLKPWTDFPKVQLEAWNDIYTSFGDARLFNSLQYIEENGQYLRRKIGSEEDLERFQGNAVENILSSILNELHHDVSFENNSLPSARTQKMSKTPPLKGCASAFKGRPNMCLQECRRSQQAAPDTRIQSAS